MRPLQQGDGNGGAVPPLKERKMHIKPVNGTRVRFTHTESKGVVVRGPYPTPVTSVWVQMEHGLEQLVPINDVEPL